MAPSLIEKWPVELKIVRVAVSPVAELEMFLLTGVMNAEQAATLAKRLPVLSEFEIENGLRVLSTLANGSQLRNAYDLFIPLAKEFRGQYYAIANRFIEVCRPFFEE